MSNSQPPAPEAAPKKASNKAIKDFVALNSVAILSTHSKSCAGYPFGSVVPYDVTPVGGIVLFISRISEHFRNLEANGKASILIADSQGREDPQPYARTTLLADFAPVADAERESIEASYWKRFAHAPSRALAHDFVFFLGSPARLRWIGGFGDIRWVDGQSYVDAPLDPVAYHGQPICKHMNEDHRDALAEFVADQHGVAAAPNQCQMTAVCSDSLTVSVGKAEYRIAFPRVASNPGEVRKVLIELLGAIRGKAERE